MREIRKLPCKSCKVMVWIIYLEDTIVRLQICEMEKNDVRPLKCLYERRLKKINCPDKSGSDRERKIDVKTSIKTNSAKRNQWKMLSDGKKKENWAVT